MGIKRFNENGKDVTTLNDNAAFPHVRLSDGTDRWITRDNLVLDIASRLPGIAKVMTVNSGTANIDEEMSSGVINVTRTTSGSCVLTIKSTAIAIEGFNVTVKDSGLNASVNNITIATEGAEKIEGEDTLIISGDGDSISLFSNGDNLLIY